MKKSEMKKYLKTMYQAPEPKRKKDFLQKNLLISETEHSMNITIPRFLMSQLRYIRIWGWLASATVLIAVLWYMGTLAVENRHVWIVSSFVPFLAVTVILEVHRSAYYKMSELEQAARFSLKAVIYARLCILGLSSLLLLSMLTPFMIILFRISFLEAIICLICPYTATSYFCLLVLRHWHSYENVYVCIAVSAAVGLMSFFSENMVVWMAEPVFYIWILLFLIGMTGLEYKKYLKSLEGFAWN